MLLWVGCSFGCLLEFSRFLIRVWLTTTWKHASTATAARGKGKTEREREKRNQTNAQLVAARFANIASCWSASVQEGVASHPLENFWMCACRTYKHPQTPTPQRQTFGFYNNLLRFCSGCLFGCLLLSKLKKTFFLLKSNKHPNKHPPKNHAFPLQKPHFQQSAFVSPGTM